MNTNMSTYEEIQAAYDEMMATDSDQMIDPVLMEGYIDKREENSKFYKQGMADELAQVAAGMKRLDQITIAIFFGTMFATVVVGTMFIESCDWLVSFIQ